MIRIDNSSTLGDVCGLYSAGRMADRTFHASVIEAIKAGVDVSPVLAAASISTASFPRYASFVSAGIVR